MANISASRGGTFSCRFYRTAAVTPTPTPRLRPQPRPRPFSDTDEYAHRPRRPHCRPLRISSRVQPSRMLRLTSIAGTRAPQTPRRPLNAHEPPGRLPAAPVSATRQVPLEAPLWSARCAPLALTRMQSPAMTTLRVRRAPRGDTSLTMPQLPQRMIPLPIVLSA